VCYNVDGGGGAFLYRAPRISLGNVGTVFVLGQKHTKKFPQKSFKKGLTYGGGCDIINTVRRARQKGYRLRPMRVG
jgi:hypothetical protein